MLKSNDNASDAKCKQSTSKTKNNTNKNNFKKHRPSKGQKKQSSRVDEKQTDTSADINNPAYYYEDANVLEQVMNFSFNEFGGVPTDIQESSQGTKMTFSNKMISSYYLNPSIPQTGDGNVYKMDGATTASIRNFLLLSGSNAKTTNYAPQDVTILILALAELIKIATWIARALGVAYLFNYRNRTYPESLLRAMGIDPTDFANNLANYRVRFNKLLSVASKIPFPATIPLFAKATDLYGKMYLDDDNSALAQTYLFNPYSIWLFDEAYDANGAGLKTTPFSVPGVAAPFSIYLNIFESMIAALTTSTSLNFIYSDVMRLVQNGKISNLIQFNSIPENFVVVPTYNEEVEVWLHNAIMCGEPLQTSDQYKPIGYTPALTNANDVSCDAGSNKLLYHPQFKHALNIGYEALIDFDHDNVSIEDKVKATRLSMRFSHMLDGSDVYTDIVALNDEYLVCTAIWDEDPTPGVYYSSFRDGNTATKEQVMIMDYAFSKFDWAPIYYWVYNDGTKDNANAIGDLDYYTCVDLDTVKKIYDYEIIHLLQIG